ncbi:hypothetical protein INR49_006032 [Caranx melampygus]|nr:hypothetical protein INR49_006032 [Caranx melampygus]
MSRDGGKKALLPPSVTHASQPTSQMDETPQPTAKPRQRANGKEETQQEKSALFSQSGSSMDKTGGQAGFVEFDPLSSTGRLSKDQWAYQKQNQDVNNYFASNIMKEQKPQDPGMTTDDLDKIFNQDKPTDPFASFNGSGSNRHSEYKKKSDDSKEADFHAFQRRNSQRQKHSLQSRTHPDNKSFKSQQEPASKDKTTTAAANQSLPARNIVNKSVALQPQADVKTQNNFFLGEDPFGADPFPMPTALASLEPLQVVTEETAGSMSGGKTPLQAWVSPSETQPVSAQNSNGGGLAFAPRRPHPVKPLTSVESQHATSGQAVKEIKVWDNTPGKIKVADSGQSGPYTQLTQEELITLVVKQQTDLSKKDAKIVELEEYIDNLVLRVIEEKPSILQTIPLPSKTFSLTCNDIEEQVVAEHAHQSHQSVAGNDEQLEGLQQLHTHKLRAALGGTVLQRHLKDLTGSIVREVHCCTSTKKNGVSAGKMQRRVSVRFWSDARSHTQRDAEQR